MKRFLILAALSGASLTASSYALASAAAPPPPVCPKTTPLPTISVSPSAYTFLNGTSIDPNDIVPTSSGAASFTISPNISSKTGLSFNTTTGAISGTPSAGESATTYTVTALNCAGKKATTTITVTVNDVAPAISIPSSSYTFLVGAKIEDIVPVLDASVKTVSISPDITTAGLSFDVHTGKISGTPTSALDASYILTATNGTGQTASASVYIGLNNIVAATAPPPAPGPGCEYTLFIADFQSTNPNVTAQEVVAGGVPVPLGPDGFYHVPLTDQSGQIIVDTNNATIGGPTVPYGVWEIQRSATSFTAGNSGHQNDNGSSGYVSYNVAATLNCGVVKVGNVKGANGFEDEADGIAITGDAGDDQYTVAGNSIFAESSTTTAADLYTVTFTDTSTCQYPLPAGAVSWYQAEGNDSDVLGANNGTTSGYVGFTGGEVNQAFYFDGSGNGNTVVATTNGFPSGGADRTAEGWVLFDNVNGQFYQAVFAYGGPGGGQEFGVALQGDQLLIDFEYGAVVDPNPIQQGQAYHFAAVYQAGVLSLYVDGGLTAQQALSLDTSPGSQLTIGMSPDAAAYWGAAEMTGFVDELTFYDRALSPTEIEGIYDAGTCGKAIPTSTANLYVANEGNTVEIYAPPFTSASAPNVTITSDTLSAPYGFAFDPTGDMYVTYNSGGAEGQGGVAIFAPPFTDSSVPSVVVTNGLANPSAGVAFDAAGNMYVSNYGGARDTVQVFAPPFTNDSSPVTTLTNGLNQPLGIGFDALGNLYVVNDADTVNIAVFSPPFSNGSAPSFAITDGDYYARGMTFDSSGNLYVGDLDNNVLVFSPPFSAGSSPSAIVSNGIQGPLDVAVDASGSLYVASYQANAVEVFSPPLNGASPSVVITTGMSTPLAVAIH